MSNCHVVAGRSPIDLAASRLALRAPALRAAKALTRPNRSARGLAALRASSKAVDIAMTTSGALSLKRDDHQAEIVAGKIIEAARQGEHDPQRLTAIG